MKLSAFGRAAIAAATLLLFAFSAQAAPLTVPNNSFENPAGSGSADNWTTSGGGTTGGVSHFGAGFTSASDGSQYHYLNLTGFGGPNTNSTETNAGLIGAAEAGTYTLTVAGGRRNNDATTDGSYLIELLSGGSAIGSKTVIDPFNSYASDTWNDITAVATLNPGDARIGGDLTIRLSAIKGPGGNPRSQGQFDNVRLDFIPGPLGPYSTDFENAPMPTPPATADIGDGWKVWINQFTNPGDVYDGGYAYNGGNAPAAGPQVSFIVSGQGGAPQGNQQIVVFSDYDNGYVHGTAGSYAETNVFQQQTVGAINVGSNWTFTWDAKKDNLVAPSTAFGFIKHFDSSFNLKQEVRTEMTGIPTTWDSYSAAIDLADAVVGDVIQFGFSNYAGGYNASGIVYDNVSFSLTPPILIINGSGQLTRAENVWVSGAYYNVSFVDGSCVDFYDGCDEDSDFTFKTSSSAVAAAQALLDQVLLDVPAGNFDSSPSLTRGCEDNNACSIRTPWALDSDPSDVLIRAARNFVLVDDTFVVFNAPVTQDSTDVAVAVYAVWTPVLPAEVVPIPFAWLFVLASLLAGLGIKGMRKKEWYEP